ncbi:MAG TPA: peptidase M23 [Rhodospirillaceae bacterium]|nr:peptidase M23 [Rhodospirillaceae bacterium]
MSFFSSQSTRLDSFSYIGRKGFGPLQIALSVLVMGLFIGAVTGPDADGMPAFSEPMAAVGETDVQTAPAPEQPIETILASITPSAGNPDPVLEKKRSLKVRNGDTLMSIMLSAGIAHEDAHDAVSALRAVYDPRDLRVGQRVHLTFAPDDNLKEMQLDPSVVRKVAVRRDEATSFRAFETKRNLTLKISFARGTINSSLYKSAARQNVPLSVLAELVRIYSWDVDFQREIQKGDAFEVAYERFLDDDGHVVRHGQVIYARMILSGAAKPLYRFELRPGKTDYFDDTGRSAKRPLLRTPIDGARLSSRFGKRRHPILGYTKMHRGVDFAAPTGTPIYAAGDGVITFRGRNSGYGKYIRIRHAGGFNSAYAHMSRFRKGVTQGSRVKQGQVIGYVGSTGRSTGPHLHYEILARGRQVNPLTIKMPSGIKLGRKDFARFEVKRANIATLVANLQKKNTITQR